MQGFLSACRAIGHHIPDPWWLHEFMQWYLCWIKRRNRGLNGGQILIPNRSQHSCKSRSYRASRNTEYQSIKIRTVNLIESTGSFQHCRQNLCRLTKKARQCVKELEISLSPNDGINKIIDLLHIEPPDKGQYWYINSVLSQSWMLFRHLQIPTHSSFRFVTRISLSSIYLNVLWNLGT